MSACETLQINIKAIRSK